MQKNWRAHAHSDVRSRRTKKYKETPSWGKAKGGKGYDRKKEKDVTEKKTPQVWW